MAYLCENCGVLSEESSDLCNPINEAYKKKSCSAADSEVCNEQVQKMKYTCDCGNVSADPQHLCKPRQL